MKCRQRMACEHGSGSLCDGGESGVDTWVSSKKTMSRGAWPGETTLNCHPRSWAVLLMEAVSNSRRMSRPGVSTTTGLFWDSIELLRTGSPLKSKKKVIQPAFQSIRGDKKIPSRLGGLHTAAPLFVFPTLYWAVRPYGSGSAKTQCLRSLALQGEGMSTRRRRSRPTWINFLPSWSHYHTSSSEPPNPDFNTGRRVISANTCVP